MKIIVFLLTVFFVDLFAISCPNSNLVLVSSNTVFKATCSTPSPLDQYTCPSAGGSTTEYLYTKRSDNCYDLLYSQWKNQSSCPTGQFPDANGICTAPVQCSWAVSPWVAVTTSGYNSVSCTPRNVNTLFGSGSPDYAGDAAWCSTNNTCYVRPMNCPSGQIFDSSQYKCVYPHADDNACPDGYYSRNYSTSIDGITKTCHTQKVCKTNNAVVYDYIVSCGTVPSQSQPATGPNGSQTPTSAPNSSTAPSTQTTNNCFAAESEARVNCIPPYILHFQCDPTTGVISKNTCSAPQLPTQNTPTASDSTTTATTADVKNLGNTLPVDIRNALKDFFTDGSMPHLEAIRGQLQASNILQADSNDKLKSINTSIDAGLILQSDANTKLDSIKTSTDDVKASVDGVKASVDSQKTILQQIKDLFTNDSQFPETDKLEHFKDTSIFDDVSSAASKMSDDATGIIDQYDTAKNQISNGFPNVSFPSGSCPTLSGPFGLTANLSMIGYYISPYSSFFALYIYLVLTFANLRFLFLFFISRSKS